MAVFRDWVKTAVESLVDPDKQEEVAELSKLLHDGIIHQKQAFVLADVLKDRPYKQRHLDHAKVDLYHKFLDHAWQDGRVVARERATLAWVAQRLELSEARVQAINTDHARPRFAEALARAMDDGEISPAEIATLTEIAEAGGLSLKQFVMQFFRSESEAFLRGVFAKTVANNRLPAASLEKIVATAGILGLSRADVLAAVQTQSVRLIEHVLADAKEDGLLSADEEQTLRGLLKALDVPAETRSYVVAELAELGLITDARSGKLPTLSAPAGLSVRAGELVRFHGPAIWESVKLLKNGPSKKAHQGSLTITDSRLVFSSATQSDSFGFSKVVACDFCKGAIDVELRGKPVQRFICIGGGRIPAAILGAALAMANQVLRNQDESRNSRHIPREVRQRVWQRYGGRCAECGAQDYLEYDHIIPVAKGGSNSDANVQLLCRRCNLKKSDMI